MTEVQILIAGTVISIINIFLFLYNINKDRGIFSINTITTFLDHKEKLKIKVTFSNVGHRPLYLKSIEYLDWNTNEIKGRNISMATVVKESELKYCIFSLEGTKEILEMGRFFVIDNTNKKWFASRRIMKSIYKETFKKIENPTEEDKKILKHKINNASLSEKKIKKKILFSCMFFCIIFLF